MDNKIYKFCGFGGIHENHEIIYLPYSRGIDITELVNYNVDYFYKWSSVSLAKVCGEYEFLVVDAYCCN